MKKLVKVLSLAMSLLLLGCVLSACSSAPAASTSRTYWYRLSSFLIPGASPLGQENFMGIPPPSLESSAAPGGWPAPPPGCGPAPPAAGG